MTTTKTNNKTALDSAFDFIKGSTTGAVNNAKNLVSGLTNSASNNFVNFYKDFSNSYESFKKNNINAPAQKISDTVQKTADYFNPTKGYNPKTFQMDNFWSKGAGRTLSDIQNEGKSSLQNFKGTNELGVGIGLKIPTILKQTFTGDNNAKSFGYDSSKDLIKKGLEDISQSKDTQKYLTPDESGSFIHNITDPTYLRRNLIMSAPTFITSLGLGALTAYITKNPFATQASAYITSFPQNAAQMYLDAKDKGVSDDEATKIAAGYSTIASVFDSIGIGEILKNIPGAKELEGKIIKNVIIDLGKSIAAGASTQSVKQIIANAAAKVYYDPERPLSKEVPETAFFGGLMAGLGHGVGLGISSLGKGRPVVDEAGNVVEQTKLPPTAMTPEDADLALKSIHTLDNTENIGDFFTNNYQDAYYNLNLLGQKYLGDSVYGMDATTLTDKMKQFIPFEFGNTFNQNITPQTPQQKQSVQPILNRIDEAINAVSEKKRMSTEQTIAGIRNELGNIKNQTDIENVGKQIQEVKNNTTVTEQDLQPILERLKEQNPNIEKAQVRKVLKGIEQSLNEKINQDLEPIITRLQEDAPKIISEPKTQQTEQPTVDEQQQLSEMDKRLQQYRGYGLSDNQNTIGNNDLVNIEQQIIKEINDTDNVISQYELLKKNNPNIMSKSAIMKVKAELNNDLTSVQEMIKNHTLNESLTQTRGYGTGESQLLANSPSNEELAMNVLESMRKSEEIPTQGQVKPEITQPKIDFNEKATESTAPGIKPIDRTKSDFVPSTEWQVIPEGTVVPPGGTFNVDLENNTAYGKWTNDEVHNYVVAKESINTTAPSTPEQTNNMVPEGDNIRGHTETVQENSAYRKEVRDKVFSTYTPLSEKEIFAKAQEDVLNNPGAVRDRIMGSEPTSPEILALGEALFLKKQFDANEAEKMGNKTEAAALDAEATQIDNAISQRLTPAAQILHYAKRFSSQTPQALIRWAERVFEEANSFSNLSPKRLVKKLTGKEDWKINFTEELRNKIKTEQRKINLMPDGEEKWKATNSLMRSIVKDIPPSVMQYTNAYRYQNMLISPKTQMRNISNNMFNMTVLRPMVLASEGVNDFIFNGLRGKERTAYVSDVGKYYKGVLNSLPDAVEAFKAGWGGEHTIDNKFEGYGNLSQFTGENLPKSLTITGRALEGADLFFTKMITDGEYNILRSRGMGHEEAQAQAIEKATEYLYRKNLDPYNRSGQGKLLSWFDHLTDGITKLRNKGGVLNPLSWFIPFIKVPMSVAKMGIEFSPLGYATLIGANNASEQIAKANIGVMMMSLGAMAALKGKTTWQAPTDEEEKKLFYQSGKKPFSLGVPTPDGRTAWIPFNYFGPLGYSIAFPAALKYRFQDAPEAFTDNNIVKFGKALADELKMWSQQTFLSGLGGFVNTFEGNIDYSVINNLAFTAGQLIPLNGMVSYVDSIYDPIYRKPKGFVEGLTKGIPGLSNQMESIKTAIGEDATRLPEQDKIFNAVSNYVAPYAVGLSDKVYEPIYQEKVGERQIKSEANYYKKLAETNSQDLANAIGSGMDVGNEKALLAKKQNLETLLDSYMNIDNQDYRDRIKNTIERQGYDFDEQLQKYLLKDEAVQQQGLSSISEEKLKRSNEYAFIRKLMEKDGGTGIMSNYIDNQMKLKDITSESFQYDEKTNLPDDIQLDEIKSGIADLTGNDLIAQLISYRKVSEGTRKPLLTDTLIGQLKDDGVIGENMADLLKSVVWDEKTNTFTKKSISSGKKKDYKISVKKTQFKQTPIKIHKPIRISPIKITPLKISSKGKANLVSGKLGIPNTLSTKLRIPVKSIYGLGR